MNREELAGWIKFWKFWLSTAGKYLHEASVLILVFVSLEYGDGKLELTRIHFGFILGVAILLFVIAGFLEWAAKESEK